MKRIGIIFLSLASILAASCSVRPESLMRPVELVEGMLADTTQYYSRQVIAAGAAHNDHGTIAVVGAPQDVILVTEGLLTSDFHDNISARHESDGLPDFAGETVAQVLDIAGAPYSAYGTMDQDQTFRTLNVHNFLQAVDTTCLRSQADESSIQFKQRAKLVVFASSYSSAARFDIDTLCSSLGVKIPVFMPVETVADYSARIFGERPNLMVWADADKAAKGVWKTGVHGTMFQTQAPEAGVAADSTVRAGFLRALDNYLDSGNEAKLSGLVIDNVPVAVDALRRVVDELLSTDDDNLLIYRNILNPDFECFSVPEAIAHECYAYLRAANAFTHRIAYPELRSFFSSPSADHVVELRDRYFSEQLMDFMEEYAPKTFSLYVR